MTTDGVAPTFLDDLAWHGPQPFTPRHADRIMRDYGREGDDALVLVARY
jgi:hypothetical protein